jgi:hypothetical protein
VPIGPLVEAIVPVTVLTTTPPLIWVIANIVLPLSPESFMAT